METSTARQLPGGGARRTAMAGVRAGAPLTRVDGPKHALALVAGPLAEAELQLRGLLHSDVAAVPEIAGYLAAAGGKRLRPALVALGARALGLQAAPRLMCVGELIHLGSLLHDDVVDDATSRRGQPAAHRVYGSAVTVLTGDFCLARAVLLAAEEGGQHAVTALARTVTEMAEGEVLQLQQVGNLDCSFEAYLDVVDRKSAALISWCAAASAWATADLESAAALERYGRGVGRAFQITDDVLDYATGTGKAPGADLRERKVTLPLLLAMERVAGLRETLRGGPPTAHELPDLMAAVRGCGALDDALEHARGTVARATRALAVLPDTDGRAALDTLGRYLVERVR